MDTVKLLKSILVVALLASASVFASASGPTSGQLVVINSLGNTSSGNAGETASAISVVVSDTVGPCSTTGAVPYNGVITIKWSAANIHNSLSCKNIVSVVITPLKVTMGSITSIVYDSVTTTTVPALTATAITLTPPTTVYENMALIVNGSGIPASTVTASATAWGVGAAATPVFSVSSGALSTVGVPGALGVYGLKAENLMRRFAVIPFRAKIDNY